MKGSSLGRPRSGRCRGLPGARSDSGCHRDYRRVRSARERVDAQTGRECSRMHSLHRDGAACRTSGLVVIARTSCASPSTRAGAAKTPTAYYPQLTANGESSGKPRKPGTAADRGRPDAQGRDCRAGGRCHGLDVAGHRLRVESHRRPARRCHALQAQPPSRQRRAPMAGGRGRSQPGDHGPGGTAIRFRAAGRPSCRRCWRRAAADVPRVAVQSDRALAHRAIASSRMGPLFQRPARAGHPP